MSETLAAWIAACEERESKATEGPWELWMSADDAAFIAHACNDLPTALRLVRVLMEACEKAADTFADFDRANRMLSRFPMAEAAKVAREGSSSALIECERIVKEEG